jgi:hypothetical protein
MAARYCTVQHVYCPAGGAPILSVEGALRDSLHPAVVANPALFSVTAPVAGTAHVDAKLFGYLGVHSAGPEF